MFNLIYYTMKNESKCLNPYPVVVTNPTPYKGGMNTYPVVVINPTPYKGGLNIAACDIKVK